MTAQDRTLHPTHDTVVAAAITRVAASCGIPGWPDGLTDADAAWDLLHADPTINLLLHDDGTIDGAAFLALENAVHRARQAAGL